MKILNKSMSQAQQSPSHRAKILIVDDKPDNIELLSIILSSQGYKIEESDRGDLAIASAKTNPPDLILLDVCMPEMDGFQVCQILRRDLLTQNIPIIFITGIKEAKDKTQAFNLGGNDYVTKPFQIEEVIARVENQLKVKSLQAELQAKNIRLEEEIRQRQATEDKLLILNQKLNKLATLDGLTQIANRHRFDEFLTREWQRGRREKFDLSLILSDIDYFKLYNDNLGHQAGDICLTKVAQTISQVVQRPADLVARYGGEEFAVILPRTPYKNALQVAEKIRLQIKKLCIPHPDSLVGDYVSLSLGVTSIVPSSKHTIKQLLVTADKALYQAKKQGRDQSVLRLI